MLRPLDTYVLSAARHFQIFMIMVNKYFYYTIGKVPYLHIIPKYLVGMYSIFKYL